MILALVVFSCLATTNFSDFDPHQIGAAHSFIITHPDTCGGSDPAEVQDDVTLEECESQGMLHVLPQWQTLHPERIYMGAVCVRAQRTAIQERLREYPHE